MPRIITMPPSCKGGGGGEVEEELETGEGCVEEEETEDAQEVSKSWYMLLCCSCGDCLCV